MSAAPATSKQIGAIHALKARVGLDDDTYRDMLFRETGRRSAKDLSRDQAERVRLHLRVVAGQEDAVPPREKPLAEGALKLDGPYVGVCRALWLAAYNLGVTGNRRDTAMVAFVERQTGLKSLNWLRDQDDARAVIEALKSWINRVQLVAWDADAKALRERGMSITRWRKLAVVRAQLRLLGEVPPAGLEQRTDAELNTLQAELGRRIRRQREKRGRA